MRCRVSDRERRREWERLRDEWIAGGRKGPKFPTRAEYIAGSTRADGTEAQRAPEAPRPREIPRERMDRRAPDGPGDVQDSRIARSAAQPRAAVDERRSVMDPARASKLCAVVNDIHWPAVREGCWNAFRAWHRDWRPSVTVINGDALDFEPISSHPKSIHTPTEIASSIETFVVELNALACEAGRVVFLPGNHERRLSRYLGGATPQALKGLRGLTLQEICVAHGLRRDVEWVHESAAVQGFRFADFLIRHGDGQSSRFGGGVNPAQTQLRRSFGQSIAFGHTHRAGITTATAGGRTFFGVANGCFQAPADYAPDAAWERSFLVLEALAPDYVHATPTLVVMQGSRFSYGGRTYGAAEAA